MAEEAAGVGGVKRAQVDGSSTPVVPSSGAGTAGDTAAGPKLGIRQKATALLSHDKLQQMGAAKSAPAGIDAARGRPAVAPPAAAAPSKSPATDGASDLPAARQAIKAPGAVASDAKQCRSLLASCLFGFLNPVIESHFRLSVAHSVAPLAFTLSAMLVVMISLSCARSLFYGSGAAELPALLLWFSGYIPLAAVSGRNKLHQHLELSLVVCGLGRVASEVCMGLGLLQVRCAWGPWAVAWVRYYHGIMHGGMVCCMGLGTPQ